MDADSLRELVRRWMSNDKTVVDEIVGMNTADQKAVLKHVMGAARRSATVQRLEDVLRRRGVA